jgi:hypothetical protein
MEIYSIADTMANSIADTMVKLARARVYKGSAAEPL